MRQSDDNTPARWMVILALCCRTIIAAGFGIPAVYFMTKGLSGMLDAVATTSEAHLSSAMRLFTAGLITVAIGVMIERIVGD